MSCKAVSRLAVCLLLSSPLCAQSNANDEILKLVKNGMPESVVIDKIHDAAGHLDTSADALIALKSAGATAPELAAMTSRPQVVAQPVAVSPQPAVNAPIPFADGLLYVRADGPYIEWSGRKESIFPNNDRSNRVYLTVFQGKPAFRVPAEWIFVDVSQPGSVLITADRVIFDPYCLIHATSPPKHGQLQKGDFELPESRAGTKNARFDMPRSEATLLRSKSDEWKDTAGFRKGQTRYYLGFHVSWEGNGTPYDEVTSVNQSPLLMRFVANALKDFDGMMASLLQASGIQDVNKQLGPAAHYTLFAPPDIEKYKAVYQSQLDHGPPLPVPQSGFAQFAQVLSAGATALQQTQAGGGTIAAQAAAKAQYDRTVASIMNGTNTSAAPTSAGSTQTAAVSAADSTGSNTPVPPGLPSSGTAYTGPNAGWVHAVLGTAGTYSCTPIQHPAVRSTWSCQRDGKIYSAQQLAWASECSAATGHPDDAQKDAAVLMDTLRSAKSMCNAQASYVKCDTDGVISCGLLPN